MSLEQALAANTAALEALTAALAGAKVGGTAATTSTEKPATEKAKPGRPPAKEKAAPVHTRDELSAALTELKEKTGSADAPREIIKSVGGAEKSKDIADEKIDAVYDAVKAALVALEDDGEV